MTDNKRQPKHPASSNRWIVWVLEGACCLIAAFIVYPATMALTHEVFIAVVATVVIATIMCVCVWQIWNQLDGFRGKKRDDEAVTKAEPTAPQPSSESRKTPASTQKKQLT